MNGEYPLRSARILWGLYCSAEAHCVFSVAMSDVEKEKFIRQLRENAELCIDALLSQVDIMQSAAVMVCERESILKAVQSSCGVGAFNARVSDLLRDWAIHFVSALLPSQGTMQEEAPEASHVGVPREVKSSATIDRDGEPAAAEILSASSSEMSSWTVLSLKVALAQLYLSRGLAETADFVVKDSLETLRALEEREKEHDNNNKAVVPSPKKSVSKIGPLRAISRLFETRHKLESAEELLLEALESTRAVFGDTDERTLSLSMDLARVYRERGLAEKAEAVLTETATPARSKHYMNLRSCTRACASSTRQRRCTGNVSRNALTPWAAVRCRRCSR
jgi:hypothetical protein